MNWYLLYTVCVSANRVTALDPEEDDGREGLLEGLEGEFCVAVQIGDEAVDIVLCTLRLSVSVLAVQCMLGLNLR